MLDERDIPIGTQQQITGDQGADAGQPYPDKVAEVRDRFTYAIGQFERQREEERKDLYFADVDEWDPIARQSRMGEITEDGLAYAKPTHELHMAEPGIQMALEEARAAKLSIELVSRGTKPSLTTRYMQQYIEQIQRESGALDVRMDAIERMLKCGFGVYAVGTRYAEDNPTLDAAVFDQEPYLEPLKDQGTALYDPDAQLIDKSDSRFWIRTMLLPIETRRKRWPNVKPIDDGAFYEDPQQRSSWYSAEPGGRNRHVRVAYYYKRVGNRRLVLFHPEHADGQPVYEDDAPKELKALHKKGDERVRWRYVVDDQIMRCVVDGHNVLEEGPYAGKFFPFIPVFGRRAFIDGVERYRGVISYVRDSCQGLNLMFSAAVQALSQPISWVMGDEQADELEDLWDLLWKNPRVRLPYRPQVEQGQLLPPPTPAPVVASIEHLIGLIQQTRDFIALMTGTPQFTTNANAPRERSQASVEGITEQGSRLYSVYIRQWGSISMLAEGQILVDLIGVLFDRPGRRLRLRSADGKEAEIVIKRPFYHDETGEVVEVKHAACNGTGIIRDELGRPMRDPACEGTGFAPKDDYPETVGQFKVQYIDFSEGQHLLDVTVGRQEENAKRERVTAMGVLAGAAPDYVKFFLDQFFRDLGLPELAERVAKNLPEAQDDLDSAITPLAKQMLAEKDAQLEAMQQALQQANEFIRTEQTKWQGQKEVAEVKGQIELERDRRKHQLVLLEKMAEAQAAGDTEQMRGLIQQAIEGMKGEFMLTKVELETASRERVAGMQAETATTGKAIDASTKQSQQAAQERISAADRASNEREGAAARASTERTAAENRAAGERTGAAERASRERTAAADRQSGERQAAADRAANERSSAADRAVAMNQEQSGSGGSTAKRRRPKKS